MTPAQDEETTRTAGARRLLRGNEKVDKGLGRRFLTWTLMLAPNRTSGRDVCPGATAGCKVGCPGATGRQRMGAVMDAHIENTRLLFEDGAAFARRIHEELDELERVAERRGFTPCARLNDFSDLDWSEVAARHPRVVFYDYTKRPDLMRRFLRGEGWPRNYHLTFSRNEANWRDCVEFLEAGGNVAVVFRHLGAVPPCWNGRPVIDGTADDLRFLDARAIPGNIVALRATPAGRRDRTGFVVDL
jgi:hypothetical protein